MTDENLKIPQISGLDITVVPKGATKILKTDTVSILQQPDCIKNCEGKILPKKCPITGKRLKSIHPEIQTDEKTLDLQLKSAYCIPIDIQNILEKFAPK